MLAPDEADAGHGELMRELRPDPNRDCNHTSLESATILFAGSDRAWRCLDFGRHWVQQGTEFREVSAPVVEVG